jgi:hypothetical protein
LPVAARGDRRPVARAQRHRIEIDDDALAYLREREVI